MIASGCVERLHAGDGDFERLAVGVFDSVFVQNAAGVVALLDGVGGGEDEGVEPVRLPRELQGRLEDDFARFAFDGFASA